MKHKRVSPLSRSQIRAVANLLRDELGLKNIMYMPIEYIYEVLQHWGLLEFEIVDELTMGGDEGLTFPEKNLIQIREDVYDGAVEGVGRHRFTMAHELGHLFLHRGSVSFARSKLDIKPFEDPEWQANCFAGEFLVSKELCMEMPIPRIAAECGVSPKAARVQKNAFDK